jgi:hypothetical protein
LNPPAVEQQVVARLVRQNTGTGELALLALVVDRHAVELGGRIALARQVEDGSRDRAQAAGLEERAGRIHKISEQRLVRRADAVVVAERRIEFLALVGVTNADGRIDLRRDVEDVVGEERPVAAVLMVGVLGRAEVVEILQVLECLVDQPRRRSEQRRA